MELFHHKLLTEGMQIDGVILEWHPGSTVSTTRLVVGFKPDGGERIEFSQNITDYVKAPAETLRERRDRDVIPLSLLEGESIPVRYRADKPSHAVIDEPELHRRAIEHYQRGQQDARRSAEAKLEHRTTDARGSISDNAPEQPSQPEHDKIELLAELANLHTAGQLSDDEFAAAKRQLLADDLA